MCCGGVETLEWTVESRDAVPMTTTAVDRRESKCGSNSESRAVDRHWSHFIRCFGLNIARVAIMERWTNIGDFVEMLVFGSNCLSRYFKVVVGFAMLEHSTNIGGFIKVFGWK